MGDLHYQSVKDAISELRAANLHNYATRPATVRLPPVWGDVHEKERERQAAFQSRSSTRGFPRAEDTALGFSSASSLSQARRPATQSSALGGSQKSGLNHTSTHFYGEAPLKPMLCEGNPYNITGSYSMFGSQARS